MLFSFSFKTSPQGKNVSAERRINYQLVLTVDASGRPVYKDGSPALIKSHIARLKSELDTATILCSQEPPGLLEALKIGVFYPEMPDRKEDQKILHDVYSQQNAKYLEGAIDYEQPFFVIGHPDSPLSARDIIIDNPGNYISKIHLAVYYDLEPPEGDFDQIDTRAFEKQYLEELGFRLDKCEYQTIVHRVGSRTLATLCYQTWRYHRVSKPYFPMSSIEDQAWLGKASDRIYADNLKRKNAHARGENVILASTRRVQMASFLSSQTY